MRAKSSSCSENQCRGCGGWSIIGVDIGAKVGGTQNFEVIIDTAKKGGVTTFDLFQRIKGLQTYLANAPGVDQSLSIVDYCELMDRAIQSNGTNQNLSSAANTSPSGAQSTPSANGSLIAVALFVLTVDTG